MKSVQFFPLILWYFMFWIKILIFWEKRIDSGPIFYMFKSFFGPNHYKNLSLCSWEITKKSFRRKLLKFFPFLPYGFDYLGFLTNAHRGAMRSKTQWVFYRDLEWWPGPQKVQFWKTTGYPEVVGLILALLRCLTIWRAKLWRLTNMDYAVLKNN